ncbi:MAG: hypothetical protein ACREMM_09475 [Gemmatimonadales bacterium]
MLLSAYPPTRLTAQDSQFGIRGLGTPGRFETVRARATGGAFAPFDAMSPLMEAQLGDVPRLTATAMGGTSYRDADLDGRTTSLRGTRFPVLGFAQPVFRRLILSGSYSTYLDKSWHVTIRDSTVLRGTMQPYTDDISSDGGVADLRVAAAARVSAHLAVGVGVHLLSGSARMAALRTFDAVGGDTLYQPLLQREDVRYTGLGISGSALAVVGSRLRLAAFARADNRLRAWVGGDQLASEADLPSAVGGAVGWWPSPSARFAVAVARRSWADAGPNAFNTVSWSAGAELGGAFSPVRLGVRGGRLPFGPGATAPQELGFAVGTGMAFSQGRALLDVGVEHLRRTGGGLTERVWTFLAGLTIRP